MDIKLPVGAKLRLASTACWRKLVCAVQMLSDSIRNTAEVEGRDDT